MHRKSSVLLASAIAAILVTSAAHADEIVLKEVVVTASQGKNPLDVAQPTAVLAGDDLSRQLAGSLGETLSSQMGVSSTYFGPTASRPVIRGLGGYRVQTLQDGIASLDVGSLSDDHAVSIDPSLAEQLEILKGPATLLYGSGASGGLINVVTHRIPTQMPSDGFGALGELRGDSAADERAGVFALDLGGAHFALHGDYFKSQSDAVDIPGATVSTYLANELVAAGEPVTTHMGQIPNAFSDTQGGAFGASWLAEQGMIGASASRYETTYGIPSEAEAFIDMQQNRYDAKAEWRASSGWLRSVSLTGAYNDYTHTEFEAPGVPGTVFTQDAYELRAAADHVHSNSWRGTFGAQLTQLDFVAAGEEAFVPASVTDSIGVFFLEEVDVGDWALNAGARVEKQTISATLDLPQFDNTAYSFASGAVVDLSSDDTIAINLTHTARHPQATELYANGPHIAAQRFEIGDAALDTEIANTIDFSLRRDSDGISWLVNVFYNDYQNFIFADPTGNIVDGLNEVQYRQAPATLYGYEAELWLPIAGGANNTWRLRLMSDYVRGERNDGEPLPQMPPLRIGAGVHFDQSAWHAAIEAIHNAEQNRLAANELPTDSYAMLNADISYRFDSTGGDWLLFLRGTNLLNEEARQSTSSLKDSVPLPGRSLHAGIRITF